MGEALRTTFLQASYGRTLLFSFSTLEAHFPTKSSRRSTCLPLPRLELGQHLKFPRYEPQSGGPPGLWKFTGLTEACCSKALRKLRSNLGPQDVGCRVTPHLRNPGLRGGQGQAQSRLRRKQPSRYSAPKLFITPAGGPMINHVQRPYFEPGSFHLTNSLQL